MARTPLKLKQEKRGKAYAAYFWHPIFKRTERIKLGKTAATAETNLKFLNAIFMNPDNWERLPEDTPIDIRNQWLGVVGGVELSAEDLAKVTPGQVAALTADAQHYKDECLRLQAEIKKLRTILKREYGKSVREGPSPTLKAAADAWGAAINAKVRGDPTHKKNLIWDIARFVRQFGEKTLVDDMGNREKDIAAWLDAMETKEKKDADGNIVKPAHPISAGRRMQIRRHVLRFLEDSGATLNRKAVPAPEGKDIRRDRGAIRWLDAVQVAAVAARLAGDWKDVFQLQCAIGLRPSEIPTLKRSDISGDFERLTLSPLGALTLKTGSRPITIERFPTAREILKRRAATNEIIFAHDGKPFGLDWFNRSYNRALNKVREAAGIPFRLDARIGRRSCASQLIREGKSIEAVASLLGDDPNTVREHYGKLLSHEI